MAGRRESWRFLAGISAYSPASADTRGHPRLCYDTLVTDSARRRFLARLGIGSAALGAFVGRTLPVNAQQAAPRRHAVDDWMDALPIAHRMLFDASSAQRFDDVCAFASNVFTANRNGYGLANSDIGVLIILRHSATSYAFNDAMWAKYGEVFARDVNLEGKPPAANPANVGSSDTPLDALSRNGAQFGVCAMATRRLAGLAARGTGSTTDAVFEELGKNLVSNAHLTPAGIVAVGRAQERGFAFGYAG